MPTKYRPYTRTDWRVYTDQTTANAMILGLSQLGGVSVLSGSGFTTTLLSGVTGITISEGSRPSNGLFFNVQPATATVTINVKNFTVSDVNKYLINSPIRIALKNENTVHFSQETTYFYGFVDNADVTPNPGENYVTIVLSATSRRSKDLNRLMLITKNTTALKSDVIAAAWLPVTDSTYPFHPNNLSIAPSSYHYGSTNTEDKSVGEWLSEFAQTDLFIACDTNIQREGYAVVNGGGYDIFQDPESLICLIKPVTKVNEDIYMDEYAIHDFSLAWDGSDSPTSVNLSMYDNNAITYTANSATTDTATIGANNYVGSPDVKNLAELTTVGNSYLSNTRQFIPVLVASRYLNEAETIYFNGATFTGTKPGYIPSTTSATAYYYPGGIGNIGDTFRVSLSQFSIDRKMIVIGRTFQIDVNGWTMVYDLWKGL